MSFDLDKTNICVLKVTIERVDAVRIVILVIGDVVLDIASLQLFLLLFLKLLDLFNHSLCLFIIEVLLTNLIKLSQATHYDFLLLLDNREVVLILHAILLHKVGLTLCNGRHMLHLFSLRRPRKRLHLLFLELFELLSQVELDLGKPLVKHLSSLPRDLDVITLGEQRIPADLPRFWHNLSLRRIFDFLRYHLIPECFDMILHFLMIVFCCILSFLLDREHFETTICE